MELNNSLRDEAYRVQLECPKKSKYGAKNDPV